MKMHSADGAHKHEIGELLNRLATGSYVAKLGG